MILRPMKREELPEVLDWAAQEGWNPGHHDAEAFYAADPDGFFVAESGGAPVAAISVVNHDDEFAFLGLYICLEAHRGKGIGLALWTHALAHAGTRTVGLDGVPEQQENYRRSGFALAGQTSRFAGVLTTRDDPAIRPAVPSDLDALIDLDTAAHGYSRRRFHERWLEDAETRRTFVFDEGQGPLGFATIRHCRDGAKIGPVLAPDPARAIRLIHAAAAFAPAGLVVIDVPESELELLEYCRAEGMTCAFTTARMYRGPAPKPGPGTRTVATLELG